MSVLFLLFGDDKVFKGPAYFPALMPSIGTRIASARLARHRDEIEKTPNCELHQS